MRRGKMSEVGVRLGEREGRRTVREGGCRRDGGEGV